MTDATAADERVRKSLDEVMSALSRLADEVALARDDHTHSVDAAGRTVLTVSAALASTLVDLIPEFELEYGDLDEVLHLAAARLPANAELVGAAECVDKLFQELRKISYNVIDVEEFPDVEDANAAVERAVESLLDMWDRNELV